MFYKVVFEVDKKLPSYQFFSAFLRNLPAKISSLIHSQKTPFSISPFFSEKGKYFVKFGFFGDEILGEVILSMIGKKIAYKEKELKILSVYTNHLSNKNAEFASLEFLKKITKGTSKFSLNFLSPTFFKNGDEIIPFPEKMRVFSSMLQKFKKTGLFKESFLEENFKDFVAKSVSQVKSEIEVRKKKFKGFFIEGFVGKCVYELKGEEEKSESMRDFVSFLAKTSEFFGIGNKTNFGFGSVSFKRLN